jgi:hypothetical protein
MFPPAWHRPIPAFSGVQFNYAKASAGFAFWKDALISCTSAHKMDDLEPISILNQRSRPIIPGNDVAVAFDRDPIGFHAELLDKLPKGW